METPWDNLFGIADVDLLVEDFSSNIINLMNKHAPLRIFNRKRYIFLSAGWLTATIRREMLERDIAYCYFRVTRNADDFERFRRLRNRANQLIKNAKAAFFDSIG